MSENSSEFLKRTCLICGCHTNQTINIYEPRSGPNIVQLIQAKFKFQPLNEDKYLCFSCNNWLINWHSLQALNSNDAESPSGTFRSHLNSGNVVQDENSSGSKKQVVACRRPMAIVRPRLVEEKVTENQMPAATLDWEHEKPATKINFNKRSFRSLRGGRGRSQQQIMQMCACGKCIIVRTSLKSLTKKSHHQLKCRKCSELSRLKEIFTRSNMQVECERDPLPQLPQLRTSESEISMLLSNQQNEHHKQQHQQRLCLPMPSINGKVVSMLRRLGTTLSRETTTTTESNALANLPIIMSPAKPKQKWLRPLDDDEILVNFDTSISEALPSLTYQLTRENSSVARRSLMFPSSVTAEVRDLCCKEDEKTQEHKTQRCQKQNNHILASLNLPKGLSITIA